MPSTKTLLLALAAAALPIVSAQRRSGVDIILHQNRDCTGDASAVWKNVDPHAGICYVLPDGHFGTSPELWQKPAQSLQIQLSKKAVQSIDIYGYNRLGDDGTPMCMEGGPSWAYPQGEIHLRDGQRGGCEAAKGPKKAGNFPEDRQGFRSVRIYPYTPLDKRGRGEAKVQPCKRGPLPDFMSFGGEAHYNLTGLDERAIGEISQLHTSRSDMPEEFKRRMVTLDEVMAE